MIKSKWMRVIVRALVGLALTFGVPLGASAQISYDEAVRAYNAAVQIQNEVWLGNPNQAEALRHAMIIARNHGFDPGFEPAELDASIAPDGAIETRCRWIQDENGEWEERCSEWTTYAGCYSDRRIGHLRKFHDYAAWLGWIFTAAGTLATSAHPPAAGVLFGASVVFQGGALVMSQAVRTAEDNRCGYGGY